MNTQQEKLKECVEAAIADFNANEQYLIRNDLSERCICAKYATYLEKQIQQSEYSDYVVDVEYNRGYRTRQNQNSKTLSTGNPVLRVFCVLTDTICQNMCGGALVTKRELIRT